MVSFNPLEHMESMTNNQPKRPISEPLTPAFLQVPAGLWSNESRLAGQRKAAAFVTRERMIDLLKLHGGPAYQDPANSGARAKIESLLADHDRFFSAQAGKAANLSKRAQTTKNLLIAINQLTQESLAQVSTAFDVVQQLAGECVNLDQCLIKTSHFSPSYLNWVTLVRAETAATQEQLIKWLLNESRLELDLKNYELETDLHPYRGDGPTDEETAKTNALALALQEHRSQPPIAIQHLVTARAQLLAAMPCPPWLPDSNGPHIVAPTLGFGWPFPAVFRGQESPQVIYTAHHAYAALGKWVTMTSSGLVLELDEFYSDDIDDLDEQAAALKNNVQQALEPMHQAGVLLCFIANLLTVLSDPSTDLPRCELCYRRVGAGKRKYCKVHGEHSNVKAQTAITNRTRLRQSQKIALKYVAQANKLQQELQALDFFKDPEGVLSAALSNIARQNLATTPTSACDIALAQHLCLLALLRPVTGEQAFAELALVSEALCAKVLEQKAALANALEAAAATNLAIQKLGAAFAKQPNISELSIFENMDLNRLASDADVNKHKNWFETRRNDEKNIETCRQNLRDACETLELQNFFSAFFSRRNAQTELPDDANHPLTKKNRDAYQRMQANPFNFKDIVLNDLRALRAWKEIGGDTLDVLLATKSSLKVPNARKQFDIEDVKQCLSDLTAGKPTYQPTYQDVASKLFDTLQVRVTHTAVYQKVNRSGDAALKAVFAKRIK